LDAYQKIREAKKLERKLGLTIYEQVKNTVTGNEVLRPLTTIGLPAAGAGVDTKSAVSTMLLVGTAIYGASVAAEAFTLSEITENKILKGNRKVRGLLGMSLALVSAGVIMPFAVDKANIDKINPFQTGVTLGRNRQANGPHPGLPAF